MSLSSESCRNLHVCAYTCACTLYMHWNKSSTPVHVHETHTAKPTHTYMYMYVHVYVHVHMCTFSVSTYTRCTCTLPPPQSSEGVSGGGLVLSEAERKLCHRVLYDFFHGKIENPVEAGMSTWPACWVLYVAHEYVHVLYGLAQLCMQLSGVVSDRDAMAVL